MSFYVCIWTLVIKNYKATLGFLKAAVLLQVIITDNIIIFIFVYIHI